MQKLSFGFFLSLFILAVSGVSRAEHVAKNGGGTGGAPQSQAERCAQRVRQAGCILSNNDVYRIDQNVQKCKHVESDSGKTHLEVFLLDKSDKLVVFQTKGPGVPDKQGKCPVIKYTVDKSGIKDVKIIGNKTFMVSNDGQLYVMMPDQTVSEVMTSAGKSYSTIEEIKGVPGDANAVHLIGKSFDFVMSEAKFNERKKEPLKFEKTYSFESLFRDK